MTKCNETTNYIVLKNNDFFNSGECFILFCNLKVCIGY